MLTLNVAEGRAIVDQVVMLPDSIVGDLIAAALRQYAKEGRWLDSTVGDLIVVALWQYAKEG